MEEYGTGVEIKSLIMVPTRGDYRDAYNRSFDLNVTNSSLDTLENMVHETTQNGGSITPLQIARNIPDLMELSPNIIRKSNIINGWQTQRIRYILNVESEINGTTFSYYIQGYSEYYDPSYGGEIDDTMLFYINSITIVTKIIDPITNRLVARPYASFNLITDHNDNSFYEYSYEADDLNLIRPKDLLNGLYNTKTYEDSNVNVKNYAGSFHGTGMSSSRANNNPLNTITKTISSYMEARDNESIGYGDETSTLHNASALVAESNILSIPFMALLHKKTQNVTPTTFTLALLDSIEPGFAAHKAILAKDNGVPDINITNSDTENRFITSMLNTSDTEKLYIPTKETIIATTIEQSIVGLMTDNLLGSLFLTMTNELGEYVIGVSNVNSFIDGIYLGPYINRIVSYCKSVLMPELTYNNQISVSVNLYADLLGDTTISISVQGGPEVIYRYTTFADSLYSPVVTTKENKVKIVNDLSRVLDATYSGSPIV